MKKSIYLNKWTPNLYHVILAASNEENDSTLDSRVCTTLEEAHDLVRKWQQQHAVAEEDVRDNSRIDLSKLLAGIVPADFSPINN